eukprot:TRINITY_DN7824_c0_g5_i1.p1 TRINITY_DN7824_c0_g5~~TRINITY_DN7824_c0_g5_i1.p1  ORF type:complete len:1284 (-),score=144.34 TRINITY_DN7824_c0_g5_i1:60-3911(-)
MLSMEARALARVLFFAALSHATSAAKPYCRDAYTQRSDSWRNCIVSIGGLAIQGPDAFQAQLGPTFRDYLTSVYNASHGLEFEALPLNFNQNFEYVGEKKIDFIYSNPAAYTCMMVEFDIVTVASLKNFRKGFALDRFAGVIFSRVDSNFSSLADLPRARVEAVSISGLGAMQLQQAELLDMGFNIMTDVKRLSFSKNQNKIVQDVESGYADVGFVRTDMIDRSVAKGTTKWEYFQVLNEIPDASFPFKRSTAFTPEWPIGALNHVPPEISELVSTALLRLDRTSADASLSTPAINGSFATWVFPMNYLDLLGMLERISYYDPKSRKCLRADDVLQAVTCPPGWVKQAPEQAFCNEDCKTDYICLCEPCAKLRDPELVLTLTPLPTTWNPNIDVQAVSQLTRTEQNCSRMAICATVAAGQRMSWVLLDQIGEANRKQINVPTIQSVEVLMDLEGTWEAMKRENVTVDGLRTEQYVLNSTVRQQGYGIVSIRVNGQQAAMSPVVVMSEKAPLQRVFCPDGAMVEPNGTCTICQAGRSGTLETRDGIVTPVCRDCPKGTSQPLPGQSECNPCPLGTVAADTGSKSCLACPPGRSTLGKEGRPTCTPCAPGESASESGSARCLPCARGSFSSLENASTCTPCGLGQTTKEQGSQDITACACPSGSYMASGVGNERTCKECLQPGTLCNFGEPVLLLPGYYMSPSASRNDWNQQVWKCRSEKYCPGQTSFTDPVCAGNLGGLNCGVCPPRYFRSGASCISCDGGAAVAFLPLFLVGFVVCAGLFLWRANRTYVSESTLAIHAILSSICAGEALVLFQQMGIFARLRVQWPANVSAILTSASFLLFDLDVLSTPCSIPETLASAYLIPLTMPPFFVIGFMIWRPLSRFLHRMKPHRFRRISMNVILNAVGLGIQALFISTVSVTVSLLDCYNNPNNRKAVRRFPFAECYTDEYLQLIPATVFACLAYVIGFLAYVFWLSISAPKKYVQRSFRARSQFLISKFHSRCWWYGVVLLIRSTLLALVTVMAPDDGYVQFLIALAVFIAAFGLQIHFKPFVHAVGNMVSVIMNVVLIVVLCLGQWFLDETHEKEQPEMASTLSVIIIAAVSIVFVTILSAFVFIGVLYVVPTRMEKQSEEETNRLTNTYLEIASMINTMNPRELAECLTQASHLDMSNFNETANFLLLELQGRRIFGWEAMRLPVYTKEVTKDLRRASTTLKVSASSAAITACLANNPSWKSSESSASKQVETPVASSKPALDMSCDFGDEESHSAWAKGKALAVTCSRASPI